MLMLSSTRIATTGRVDEVAPEVQHRAVEQEDDEREDGGADDAQRDPHAGRATLARVDVEHDRECQGRQREVERDGAAEQREDERDEGRDAGEHAPPPLAAHHVTGTPQAEHEVRQPGEREQPEHPVERAGVDERLGGPLRVEPEGQFALLVQEAATQAENAFPQALHASDTA
jgi:hypothetical protein